MIRYAILCLLFTGISHGQPKELEPHDPEKERRALKLLPGYEVNLFAAEPMLKNPIHMTWDPQGRLWVCCSTTYPQVKPGEKPNDQIVVIEDTNGDGKADKSTVFAEGLYVPTGLELGDGGVYVANAPDLLFLKDTNGDGKADLREVVLTGFGIEDNHHSISAWRWGPGGWLYFQEGTFLHAQVETPHGVVRLENGGVFQFRPRQQRLRVYADYRASNPWGHMFDRWGNGILIDNPNLYFIAPLTANSRAKLAYTSSGRGTKQAGGEFVSGRHLPKEVQGQIWTNQYKANTVTRYQVQENGSGVTIKELEPLIRSTDPNFRPVDLKVGPDGAVYILDWYNPLIGHMQHSFRDPRRDVGHGRVWRVTAKNRPLVKKPKLVGVPLTEVVSHLKDPEDWTRYQVKRVLYDANRKEAVIALEKFLKGLDPKENGYDHHRLEALWCYQTIDVVNEKLLRDVLQSKEGQARAAALRVLRYWHDQVREPLKLLEAAVKDPHPRARLEAILTLSFVPRPQSVVIATQVLDKPMDRYLEHALTLTVDGLQEHWMEPYRAGKLKFDKPEHRAFALSHVISNESIKALVDLLNSGSADPRRLEGPLTAIAQTATAQQLRPLILKLVEQVREYKNRGRQDTDLEVFPFILDALNEAARRRGVIPPVSNRMLARFFDVPHLPTKVAAARLAGAWKQSKEARRLKSLVSNRSSPMELRIAAAQSLGELNGKAHHRFLEAMASNGSTVPDRYTGIIGLASVNLKKAAGLAAKAMAIDPKGAKPFALLSAFTDRKGGAKVLASALKGKTIHPATKAMARQHLIEIGYYDDDLVEALGGGIAKESLEGQLLRADVKKLAEEVAQNGNAARGEKIFRKEAMACITCHGISGAGPVLGPDLAAIGSSAPADYLIDSLLRPSKVIKEFYESVIVYTDKGKVFRGILVLKDKNKVVLRDAAQAGKEITVPLSQVEELEKGKSLMPKGLVNNLKGRQDFLDLVRFLTLLGKPGPYATISNQVVRRWRVAYRDSIEGSKGEALTRTALNGKPLYSQVNGLLPLEDAGQKRFALALAEVDVTTEGRAQIKVNGAQGLSLLLDGQRAPLSDQTTVNLIPGRRALLFIVDREKRKSGLRVELVDAPGSTAVYKLVGGP